MFFSDLTLNVIETDYILMDTGSHHRVLNPDLNLCMFPERKQ